MVKIVGGHSVQTTPRTDNIITEKSQSATSYKELFLIVLNLIKCKGT